MPRPFRHVKQLSGGDIMRSRKNFKFTARLNIGGIDIEDRFMYSLVIDRDFANNRFPLIMVTLNLDYVVYSDIVRKLTPTQPYIQCHMDVYSREAEHDTSPTRHYMGGSYMGIIDQQHTVLGNSTKSELDRGRDEQQQELKAVRISLFKESDLPSMQGMIHGIFKKGVDVGSLILHAFGECSSNLKLCMCKPDIPKIDDDLVIKPMGFYQFMNYIDSEYGIYKTPYSGYIEDSVYYMLNSENDPCIKVNGMVHTLEVHTLGPEYVDQYYTVRYDSRNDIITVPETVAYLETPSFRHTANILDSEIIEGSKVIISNKMTHTVNFKNYTKRDRLKKDTDAEYEFNKITLDRLRVDVKPYSVVELHTSVGISRYRVTRHLKVISFDNDSMDTLMLSKIIR